MIRRKLVRNKILKNLKAKGFIDNIVYSKLDEIPSGTSSGKIAKGCLVVEGGALRGLYNQGVLDAFLVSDINFETYIGVSAGALAGMNYISRQIGRSARTNLKYRHDPEYIGLKAIGLSRSPLNLNFLLYKNNKLEPFDLLTFEHTKQRFIAVATNCETGKTEYFEKGICKDIFAATKASASMPFLSPMVDVEGKQCLDGGCSCKIAYKWALEQNFNKIVIIKTRERGFRKSENSKRNQIDRFYKNYPLFADVLADSNKNYNKQCDEIDELEKSKRAFVIAPSSPVRVSRLEPDVNKLGELYWQGYNDANNLMEQLKRYLSY